MKEVTKEKRAKLDKMWNAMLLSDNVEAVSLLISVGYNVSSMISGVDFDGRTSCTSLELVSLFRGNKVIPLLLVNDVPRALPDQDYVEAMFESLRHGTKEVIKAFIDHGVPLNALDKNGSTLLKHAIRENMDLIPDLIELGFDLEGKDINGQTIFEYKSQVLDQVFNITPSEEAMWQKLELLRKREKIEAQVSRPKSRL